MHSSQPQPFQKSPRLSFCAFFSDSAALKRTEWNQSYYLYILSSASRLFFDYLKDGIVLWCCHWLTYRFKSSDENVWWSDMKVWALLKNNFPAKREACRRDRGREGAVGILTLVFRRTSVSVIYISSSTCYETQEIPLQKYLLAFLALVISD